MGTHLQITNLNYLYMAVKKLDLKAFIERETGANFEQKNANNWVAICPLHQDSKPSFSVTRCDNGIWIYQCFGCNSAGTIIDFCKDKFDISTPNEAVMLIADKENIKFDESLIIQASRDAKVVTDRQYNLDLAHYLASANCRRLLRIANGNQDIMSWVAVVFRKMNKMLDDKKTTPAMMSELGTDVVQKINMIQDQSESNKTQELCQ